MKRSRAYFFTGIDGITGHRFRTENRPRRTEFEDLFDSVPFILEPNDSAQENQAGHIRLETDTRAKGRMAPLADGWSRAVQGHQLPVVRNQTLPGDVVVSTGTYNGIQITEMDYVDPSTGRVRRDFMIQNGMALTSSDGSFVIANIPNGFDITAAVGLADTFKVMANVADPIPGYLAAKIEPSLEISVNNKIQVRHEGIITAAVYTQNTAGGIAAGLQTSSTNTIELIPNASLSANVRYNGTWFTEDATGLRLLPHSITQNEIALGTILGTNINTNPGFFFGDGLNHDGTRMYARVQKSIQLDPAGGANVKAIELVGDSAAPGNTKHYGTNAAGVKGWYDTPESSKWKLDYGTNGLRQLNTSGLAGSPRSLAIGEWGHTYTSDTIALSSHYYSQSYKIHLATTTGMIDSELKMGDGNEFYLPVNCSALISGTVIVNDDNTSVNACWKFSFSVNCVAGIATITSPIVYDSTSAPSHVVQAGVSPYSTPWYSSLPAADIMISVNGADTVIKFDVIGVTGPLVSARWSGVLDINLVLPFRAPYPVYAP